MPRQTCLLFSTPPLSSAVKHFLGTKPYFVNGKDVTKEISPYFGPPINPSNKYAGPNDMQALRYLILLYASKYIDLFITFRTKIGGYTCINPTKLEKVANARIFHTKILFRRADAINIYKRWREDHFVTIRQGTFVGIMEKGEELCSSVIATMISSLPSIRNQQLTENIQTLNQLGGQKKAGYGTMELRDKAENYGLNMLSQYDYKSYDGTENDFETWKNGFSFELPSIKIKQELRRNKVIEDISTKLDSEGKLLIVSETGISKTLFSWR